MSDNSDDEESTYPPNWSTGNTSHTDDAKKTAREQHNALERRRRDNIKDMYTSLREVVNEGQNDKASRAQILKKSIDTITEHKATNEQLKTEVGTLASENAKLMEEVMRLRARAAAKVAAMTAAASNANTSTTTSDPSSSQGSSSSK